MEKIITSKDFERPVEVTPSTIVKFTNFSDEDFTWTLNSIPWTFKAGDFMFLEAGVAEHFAKHLINRELLKEGRETDTSPKKKEENKFFMELYRKCIEVVDSSSNDAIKSEQEIIDRNTRAKLGLDQPVAKEAEETISKPAEEFEEIPVEDDEDEPVN